jgi:hypothetical protein
MQRHSPPRSAAQSQLSTPRHTPGICKRRCESVCRENVTSSFTVILTFRDVDLGTPERGRVVGCFGGCAAPIGDCGRGEEVSLARAVAP